MSQGFLIKKTRLSRRAISSAIIRLEVLGMVRISDCLNRTVFAENRKYRNDLYFEVLRPKANTALVNAQNTTSSMHYMPITIDTHNRQNSDDFNKQSDHDRITDILNSSKKN